MGSEKRILDESDGGGEGRISAPNPDEAAGPNPEGAEGADPTAGVRRRRPVPPIRVAGGSHLRARLAARRVPVTAEVERRLRSVCAVETEPLRVAEASRDWWPLAMVWATGGEYPALAACVARPSDASQVAEVLRVCSEDRVPVTVAAGRSGVCGGSVPVHGGVVLDLTSLSGIRELDETSLVLDVLAGTYGDDLERDLRERWGLTLGHWPQSISLSTVGGWLACRSAGQMSTRYGKIEDMVLGLDVALADGRLVRTGDAPRPAVGPDLTQVFVGSEGTLGVICAARLRVHPAPSHTVKAAWLCGSFESGVDLCRRILRRGATPAVLRLYDATEAVRNFSTPEGRALLIVLDEGDRNLVEAVLGICREEAAAGGDDASEPHDEAVVDRWLEHRNDVSALEALISKGFVVDTMEVTARWGALPSVYRAVTDALAGVEGTLVASAHLSHSYTSGACLYFTFAGRPEPDERERYYCRAWEEATRAALRAGAALSHHHGVGLNRARFMREALGDAFGVLQEIKRALDPAGVLNPGKFGFEDPFGPVGWPSEEVR